MKVLDVQYKVQKYVVCLIDLLGQKDKLKKWSSILQDDVSDEEKCNALDETITTISICRDIFLTTAVASR